MTSDWIAHGILDSIVDSFFPYLEEIGKEVMAIEDLVTPTGVDGATASSNPQPKAEVESLKVVSPRDSFEKKLHLPTLATETFSFSEKSLHVGGTTHPRFVAPQWTIPLAFRRVRRFLTRRWKRKPKNPETPPSVTTLTLRRIARARRLVTSLNRLLASKSEVITQIRKRLLNARTSGLGESSGAEGIEVAIYMGDVEGKCLLPLFYSTMIDTRVVDHILTLQHSLLHYEHLLSQSHPTYLTQLRTLGPAKNYNLLLYMSTVSVGIIPMSIIIGESFHLWLFVVPGDLPKKPAMCSLNLQLPSTPNSFYGFAAVIGIVTVIFIIHCCLVMYWWRQAKQAGKRRRS
jgi:magnesium transporter